MKDTEQMEGVDLKKMFKPTQTIEVFVKKGETSDVEFTIAAVDLERTILQMGHTIHTTSQWEAIKEDIHFQNKRPKY